MADIAELAPEILSRLENRRAAPEDLALDGAHESGHQPEQRRLAGAVAAGNAHERTGFNSKRHPLKERAFTAFTGQAADFKNGLGHGSSVGREP